MADYTLKLSDAEVARYQFMAEAAESLERDLWVAAGAVPGARIADVGCGPGAVAVRLAALAAPDGGVWAVDRDDDALAVARELAARTGVRVETRKAVANATGLPAGGFDLVMMRHVLAHNGGAEQEIVDHLATLAAPGGSVYLCDIDGTSFKFRGFVDPAISDLHERYEEFHRKRGNDLKIGTRLDELLAAAGLEVAAFRGHVEVLTPPPGMRGPAWAARDALVADGLATPDDLVRWDEAFRRAERENTQIKIFAGRFVAYGRRP